LVIRAALSSVRPAAQILAGDPDGRPEGAVSFLPQPRRSARLGSYPAPARVKLPKVRRALDYVRREFDVGRPLIDQAFQTDGLDPFVERHGQMINASRAGQQEMKEIISIYLQRIERDTRGLPINLFPFTRETGSNAAPTSDPRLVVMSSTVSFGRPVIAGTGIPVSAIYERYRAGGSVANLARDFRLETSAVEEAIRCEAA
jgi:uncharacterized protein (DUF433 family)